MIFVQIEVKLIGFNLNFIGLIQYDLIMMLIYFLFLLGITGSSNMYQKWQSSRLSTVCGDDQGAYRRSSRGFPKIDDERAATHFCRDGIRSLRVSTARQTLHASHNDACFEYS